MQAKSPGRLVSDAMDAMDFFNMEDEHEAKHDNVDTTYGKEEETNDDHIDRYSYERESMHG